MAGPSAIHNLGVWADRPDARIFGRVFYQTDDHSAELAGTYFDNGSAWVFVSPATGAAGAAGARWFEGSGAPSGGTGSDGDFYLDIAGGAGNGDVYQKASGSWGSPVGNVRGADGVGTGDVVGPSSSVASEIALFDGTTGKLIKRATTSGLVKATSGVIGAATEGTDYYGPGGTDVAVADGGTGASSAGAARTNLGLVIGTDVEAHDADLTAIAGLSPSNDDVLQRKSGAWANRTLAQLRTDLALNPLTTQDDLYIGGAGGTPARLAKGTDGQVLTVDPATHHLVWASPGGGGGSVDYPTHATLWHDEVHVTAGNGIVRSPDTGQIYGVYTSQQTAANGDAFAYAVLLKAGTYTFEILHLQAASGGHLDWELDGTPILTAHEFYAGSTAYNVVTTQSGVVVATDGIHTLTGTVNGKNGSSSGYNCWLTKAWFR